METIEKILGSKKAAPPPPVTFFDNVKSQFDQPGLPYKEYMVISGLAIFAMEQYLAYRQYRKLHATKPPPALQKVVSQETFEKSRAYHLDKARFRFVASLYDQAQITGMLVLDSIPNFWEMTGSWLHRFFDIKDIADWQISHSILFFLVFILASQLSALPISLYSTFVIEQRHGFNKQTYGLFFSDFVKGLFIGGILGVVLITPLLYLINWAGDNFVFYVWAFFIAFQFLMIIIWPQFIQPLFNKLSPLPEGKLRTSIEELAGQLHFPLTRLYVIDGSKRSSHSNAYFFGLFNKQIVIYDTLIDQSTTEEVTAVLAHEMGHWALWHLPRMIVVSAVQIFGFLSMFTLFIHNKALYTSLGFPNEKPILVGLVLFQYLTGPIDTVLNIANHMMSRKHEYEADAYAKKLDMKDELARALVRLQSENLSAVDTDWMYSAYHHSHPTLQERLEALGATPDVQIAETKKEK